MSIVNAATPLPSLYVSHGSPMIALEPGATGAFFARLGPAIDRSFGRPRAVLAVSAHLLMRDNVLLGARRHEAVHDFGGFPAPLYDLRYDAPGDAALAEQAARLLAAAGLRTAVVDKGGLDHGIWTVLRYVYPDADVPVVPLAMNPHAWPAQQFALGAALAPLRAQGVLVLATGSITHNLQRVAATRRFHAPASEVQAMDEIPSSAAFRTWVHERSIARDWDALFEYRRLAPAAHDMHPSDEHWLPFYVAAGAGGRDALPVRVHDAVTFGCLGMDAYAFGGEAVALRQALACGDGQKRA
jgi:4,5-DOPA dioxygenase extradiol